MAAEAQIYAIGTCAPVPWVIGILTICIALYAISKLCKTNPIKPNFNPTASAPTSTFCCGMSLGENYVL